MDPKKREMIDALVAERFGPPVRSTATCPHCKLADPYHSDGCPRHLAATLSDAQLARLIADEIGDDMSET